MKKLTQITQETYDSISKEWEQKRPRSWQPVINFLESIEDKKNAKLIDIGCGTGRDLEEAVKQGFLKENCVGYDFSQGLLSIIENKGFTTFVGNMKQISFEDNFFDVILSIAAHHHLLENSEQLLALKEMKRILKPKGKVLLSNWFPEKKFLEEQEKKGKFQFIDSSRKIAKVTFSKDGKSFKERYYYFFEEQELITLCEQANFQIKNKFYHGGNLYLELL